MTKYRIYQEDTNEFWIERQTWLGWTRHVRRDGGSHCVYTLEAAKEAITEYLNEELARRPVQKFRPVCHYPVLQIK